MLTVYYIYIFLQINVFTYISTGGANTTSRSGGFLLVKADSDLSESRRSYRNLTNKIHEHWDPENHNLNTGVFVRGKQQIGRNTKQDAWLTFSGSQSEDAQGIIDAFAGTGLI